MSTLEIHAHPVLGPTHVDARENAATHIEDVDMVVTGGKPASTNMSRVIDS